MKSPHISEIRRILDIFDPKRANKYFIFGSAARGRGFHDIDLGVLGNARSRKPLESLRDYFYDSPIPYIIDVVDMDRANTEFREYVFNREKIVWI